MTSALRLKYVARTDTTTDTDTALDAGEPSEVDRARAVLRQRQIRLATFGPVQTLFQDHAWDILLGLFVAHEDARPQSIEAICAATALPIVAVRRWVLAMEQLGMVTCWPHDADFTKRSVGLTDETIGMMLRFLQEM